MKKIFDYIDLHPGSEKTILEGMNHFGEEETEKLASEALASGKEIEYFYADDEAEKSDNLSYRLI